MRLFDFSSWQGILMSLVGIGLITLIGMGVRVLMMFTISQRQQRMNRQINERLRTLMAAYKVLGGAFTGKLTVDPRSRREHMRDAQRRAELREQGQTVSEPAIAMAPSAAHASEVAQGTAQVTEGTGSVISDQAVSTEQTVVQAQGLGRSGNNASTIIERQIQMRDAVEAALSDILLLGTEEHVRLAGKAAAELAQGHTIHTAELVVSLRNYIRKALDLESIPEDAVIPAQGPTRTPAMPNRGRGEGGEGRGGAGGGGMGMGGGAGMGVGMGMGVGRQQSPD